MDTKDSEKVFLSSDNPNELARKGLKLISRVAELEMALGNVLGLLDKLKDFGVGLYRDEIPLVDNARAILEKKDTPLW